MFAGGFDLEAVEAVVEVDGLDSWETVDLVASPADKSLVEPLDGRYTMLETMREYARRQLDDAAYDALRHRHRDHYLAVAERATEFLRAERQTEGNELVALDYDNMRVALATSFDDPDLDLLAALADKSLMEVVEGGTTARYAMLETIREYARGRLAQRDEGAITETLDRHVEHYTRVAEECDEWFRTTRQRDAHARIDAEYANILSAFETCLADRDAARGMRLGAAMRYYWYA